MRRQPKATTYSTSVIAMEPLDARVLLAVTASFANGVLTATGDAQDNTIVIARNAAGTILINNGAVPIQGGQSTVANTNSIVISGGLGNDNISLNEANGSLPKATMNGDDGSDTVSGGSGNDSLSGGSGDDTVIGAKGNDTVVGNAGNDTFEWNPGDGNDVFDGVLNDGGGGADRVVVNGSDVAENFVVSAEGNAGKITRDIDNVTLDLADIENVDVNALGGADSVTVNDLAATDITAVNVDVGAATDGAADAVSVTGTDGNDDISLSFSPLRVIGLHAVVSLANLGSADSLTLNGSGGDDTIVASSVIAGTFKLTEDGGAGNDSLAGSRGDDTLLGGDGDDLIAGFRGNDTALMGTGSDTFEWDLQDGSDTVDGQDGNDTLLFNATNEAETFGFILGNGGRVQLVRTLTNAPNVLMNLGGVEEIDLSARDGGDTVIVNDLSGSSLTRLNLNLDGGGGTGAGDGANDSVVINGRNVADFIPIIGVGGAIVVDGGADVGPGRGLSYIATITGSEATNDTLTINALGGDDVVDASAVFANLPQRIQLTENGGTGDDALTGSQFDDNFIWDQVDGSDKIDGRGGRDTLQFTGTAQAENFAFVANGNRVLFLRGDANFANVSMDLDVEEIDLFAGNGADTVVFNDLTGTNLAEVKLKLDGIAGNGTGDGAADSVIVNGSNADEVIPVDSFNGGIAVDGALPGGGGLPYDAIISGVEASDSLRINGNGGNDFIEADLTTPVNLSFDGGSGQDTLVATSTAPNGALRILPSSGDDRVDVNLDRAGVANVLFGQTQRIGQLNISSGGIATVIPGGATTLTVTGLGITGTGKLDLMDNDLILDYAGTTPIATVRSLLASGFNGGAWNGAGIVTGLGNASTFGLGFGEASAIAPGGTFAGQLVDGTAVLVKFRFFGDANLDGKVDTLDFNALPANFGRAGRMWTQGDFNYDGVVDTLDFNGLSASFGRSIAVAAPLAAAAVVPAGAATPQQRTQEGDPLLTDGVLDNGRPWRAGRAKQEVIQLA